MKQGLNWSVLFALVALIPLRASLAADVGVSVSISQPGLYGRIDIGDLPAPQLVYPEPIVVAPHPPGHRPKPIYLHVPRGHQRNWKRYCARYKACDRPVYFVHDKWYEKVYEPHRRRRDEERRHKSKRRERDDGDKWKLRGREDERRRDRRND
jgi:hypothetical protein